MHRARAKWWSRVSFAVVILASACSDDSANSGPPGRGSAACNQWQNAYCGLLASCQAPSQACDQVKGIACRSDTVAEQCASALSSGRCGAGLPSGCGLLDIADPAPAKKACADMQAAFCDRNEECQPGTRDACLGQINNTLNCTNAIGVTLAFEACLAEVPKISCTNPVAPDICKGVVVLSQ